MALAPDGFDTVMLVLQALELVGMVRRVRRRGLAPLRRTEGFTDDAAVAVLVGGGW